MSIDYSGHKIVEFNPAGLNGEKGCGFYRLRFHFRCQIPAYETAIHQFHTMSADISAEVNNHPAMMLGRTQLTRPMAIRTLPSPQSPTNDFYIDLRSDQLRQIEDIRNGGDLRFRVVIRGLMVSNEDKYRTAFAMDETIGYEANQKTWIDILKAVGYAEYLLFEIPVPPVSYDTRLNRAVAELTNAREHYHAGRYEDAVSTCRKVLENLKTGLEEGRRQSAAVKGFRGDRETREKLNKPQRELVLKEAAIFYAHQAAHGTHDGLIFTREDASLIITICSAFLSHSLPCRLEL